MHNQNNPFLGSTPNQFPTNNNNLPFPPPNPDPGIPNFNMGFSPFGMPPPFYPPFPPYNGFPPQQGFPFPPPNPAFPNIAFDNPYFNNEKSNNLNQGDYGNRNRYNSADDNFHHGRNNRYNEEPLRKKQHFEVLEQTHTLFFRSIPYNADPDQFRELVSQAGEIAIFSPRITKKGICFVTYNDIRDAIKAIETYNDYIYKGRQLKVIYAIEPEFSNDLYNSIFKVIPDVNPCDVSKDELYSEVIKFGEIREFTINSDNNSYTVKFFKLSDSKKFLAANLIIKGVHFTLESQSPQHQEVGNNDNNTLH